MSDELPDASNRTYKTPEEVERDRLLREAAYQINTAIPTTETAMPTKQYTTSVAHHWNKTAQTGWAAANGKPPVYVTHKPKDESDLLTEFPLRLLLP